MKILILEKSGVARRFFAEELEPAGYQVIAASTPAEALDWLMKIEGISLITLQVVMEGTDGFEFLKNLRSPEMRAKLAEMKNDDVPAVFVTSNDTDQDRLRGFQVGAADFIQKPWPRGELLATVNHVLGKSAELSGLSILVVEDSRTARGLIRTCLERLGVQVYEADDGTTALEFLRSGEHPVHMVVTDLNMREMNGDALCLHIRKDLGLESLPVIFLSSTEDQSTVLGLYKMGASDYLRKPFFQEELLARLRGYLEREKLTIELRKSVEQLEETNRLKDAVLSLCSHDLRSPVEEILKRANRLEEFGSITDAQRKVLTGITESGYHFFSLLEGLLGEYEGASGKGGA